MNSRGTVLLESILALVLTSLTLMLIFAGNAALERRKYAIEAERNKAIVRYRSP